MKDDELKEDTPQYWYELGKYHSSLKNSRSAIKSYKKCVEKNPKFYKAWSNLAAEYFQLKNYEKSIEACKKALIANPNDLNAWLTLGANYFQLNDDGRSYFCFHRASILGSKKAQKFLSKAERLNDKLITAEIINVEAEISSIREIEKKKALDKVQVIKKKRFHWPDIPGPNDQEYLSKLSTFLLELANILIINKGGVISILELYSFIKTHYPLFSGYPEDLLKALKDLEKKGFIVGVKELGASNIKIVEFIPGELSSDLKKIMDLASITEYLTFEEIIAKTSWDEYRIERAMNVLVEKHIAKTIESFREGRKWFFPGLDFKLNE